MSTTTCKTEQEYRMDYFEARVESRSTHGHRHPIGRLAQGRADRPQRGARRLHPR